MEHKLILAILLVFIMMALSSVNATDINELDDNLAINEDIDEKISQYDNEGITENSNEELNGNINDESIIGDFDKSGSFLDLHESIESSEETLELEKDYTYNSTIDFDFANGIPVNKNLTIDGKGHTISGNGEARIFYNYAGGLVLKNIIFTKGYRDHESGAVNSDNYLQVINCTFINNQGRHAGAIYSLTNVYIANCSFINNKGNYSGALSLQGTIENCTFINNKGDSYGGAVRLYGGSVRNSKFINNTGAYGGALNHNWGITLENCLFENNKATGYSSSEGTGAIDFGYAREKVIMNNCTFINNSDTCRWNVKEPSLGNKFFINRNTTLTNCTFENTNIRLEFADSYYENITVKFDGCTVINGSFKNIDATLNLSKNSFENVYIENNAKIASQVYFIVPEYAQQYGNTKILFRVVDDNGNSIHDSRIIENYIDILVENNAVTLDDFIRIGENWYYASTQNLNEGNYSINISLKNLEEFSKAYLKNTLSNGSLEVTDFNDFTSLDSEISSGSSLITLAKDYIFDITRESNYKNGIVIDRDNIVIDGAGHTINGATVARIFNITAENVVLKNINFINGYGDQGGAIYSLSNIKIENCNFTNNKAFDGGSLYIANANITNSTFTQNIANEHGGAAYLINGSIANSTFTQNSANDNGGAIYIKEKGGVKDCEFNENTARTGGAVYFESEAEIENSSFTSNSASEYAGAAYIGNGNITTSKFTSNSAKNGGAIWFVNVAIVKDSEFTSNSAMNGSGAYFNGGMTVINSTFRENTAEENGGAIYNKETGSIINSTFTENTALRGGAIVNAALLTISNTTFTDNDDAYDSKTIALIEKGSVKLNNVTPNDLIAKYPVDMFITRETGYYYEPIIYGSSLVFRVHVTNDGAPIDAGVILLNINGTNYTYDVFDGIAVINNLNYPVGNYSGVATYDGGVKYSKATQPLGFEIIKQPTVIYPSQGQYTIDQEAIFTASINTYTGNPIPGEKITFLLNGNVIGTSISNNHAVAVLELTPALLKTIKAGGGNIVIQYDGNDNYAPTSMQVHLEISQGFAQITANEASYQIDQGGDYSATVKNIAGKTLAGEELIFILEGNLIGRAVTNTNGVATIKLTPDILKAVGCGIKSLQVQLNEINYQCSPVQLALTIQKGNAKISATNSNFVMNVGGDYTVTVEDDYGRVSGEQLTFTLNGNSIGVAATDSDGEAAITLTPSLLETIGYGVYDLVISMTETNYNPASKTVKISINDGNAQIDANSTSLVFNDDNEYSVTVTDGNGVPVIGEEVTFTLNGENIGTAVTDENGIATIKLDSPTGSKNLVVNISDDKYACEAKNVDITIEKANVAITANGASYIINYGGKYSVTVKNTNGKYASGEKVTFILNGRTIGSAVTNSNGIATFTLTASMLKTAKAGSRNLVVKFDADNYNSATKTVKINIKKEKTKITAKKKTFKKAVKVKKYTITLKNSKGKAVKKAKVTLKIKGKTYKAKTSSKGKATFKIKKLTKKGTYKAKIAFKATAYYLKSSKKVKIKIK